MMKSVILLTIFLQISVHTTKCSETVGELLKNIVEETKVDVVLPFFKDKLKNNDPEIRKVTNWLQGNDAKEIRDFIESLPEYQRVNEALKKEGVDFQIWATAIKNFLEIPSPVTEIDDATGRLFDFLNQAVMTIDVNHCLAIVEGKLDSDPAMTKLANFVASEDWSSVTDKVMDLKPFKNLVETLKDESVDLLAIYDLFKAVLAVEE